MKAALEQVDETNKALKSIDTQSEQYRTLSTYASILQLSCQKLCDVLPHAEIGLQTLLQILYKVLKRHENIKFHNSKSSLRAYLRYAQDTLRIQVQEELSPALFPKQQVLLPLLVSLQTDIFDGKEKESDCQMLMNPTELTMEQLVAQRLNKTSSTWIDDRVSEIHDFNRIILL